MKRLLKSSNSSIPISAGSNDRNIL
jgi:hypothetical protein